MKKRSRVRVGCLSERVYWLREREREGSFLELKEFALVGPEQAQGMRKWSGFNAATLSVHCEVLSDSTQEIMDHPIWAVGNCHIRAYEFAHPSNQNIDN